MGRSWHGEEELAASDAANGAAQNGAAADFLERERAKNFAEAREGLIQEALDDFDGSIAPAHTGAAIGQDDVQRVRGEKLLEQSPQFLRLVADQAVLVDRMA